MAECVRWTADTERAFLLALRQTGQVKQAAAAIGRATGVCQQRRARFPAFAASWAEVVAEIRAERAAGGEGPVPLIRTRADGWTQQRQRAFARALADTGRWGEAAKRVGLSMTSVQRLRGRSPAFEAACQAALAEGAPTAAETLRQRAIDGWEEPVFHAGKQVGTRRVYSDTLLKQVAEQERAASPAERAVTAERTDASILRKLAAMRRAKDKERRAAELAWCERMEKAGWAP